MKPSFSKIFSFIFLFVCDMLAGQVFSQSTFIDSKSLNLPRYSNLSAITSAITAPQQGMMVYNNGTATNWYYNGSSWVNLATATSSPAEAEGHGSWGCDNAALKAYQPVGNDDGQLVDIFGQSVSISGDYAIVGAYGDDENGLTQNGSATIFKRNAVTGVWESQGKLTNTDAANNDFFGFSVSISGDYAMVGASIDDVNGLDDNGSATIYKRNPGTGVWEFQEKLTNPASGDGDTFGSAVSISGDYAIVGATGDDENGLTNNGSATIFKRNSGTGVWESQGKLTNPAAADNEYFGTSVSISGDYAMVGAHGDDENGLTDNGSATIFKRNPGTGAWESQGKLTNTNATNYDYFGFAVSILGDYAIVGAYGDDENGLTDNGSATIFKRNTITGIWEFQEKLINPNAANNDNFGVSVSISGNYAMVGAFYDDENGITHNGSATIYRRYGSVWKPISKSTDPTASDNDSFGTSVCIDSNSGRFLIGSPGVSGYKGLAIFGQVK